MSARADAVRISKGERGAESRRDTGIGHDPCEERRASGSGAKASSGDRFALPEKGRLRDDEVRNALVSGHMPHLPPTPKPLGIAIVCRAPVALENARAARRMGIVPPAPNRAYGNRLGGIRVHPVLTAGDRIGDWIVVRPLERDHTSNERALFRCVTCGAERVAYAFNVRAHPAHRGCRG